LHSFAQLGTAWHSLAQLGTAWHSLAPVQSVLEHCHKSFRAPDPKIKHKQKMKKQQKNKQTITVVPENIAK